MKNLLINDKHDGFIIKRRKNLLACREIQEDSICKDEVGLLEDNPALILALNHLPPIIKSYD